MILNIYRAHQHYAALYPYLLVCNMKKLLHHNGDAEKLVDVVALCCFAFQHRMRFVQRTMQCQWCGEERLQENWPLIDARPMPQVRT